MGIDGLDLTFRLEKTFGFQINRKDGEMWFVFQTPGTIHDFVWQRLQGIHPARPIDPWLLSEHIASTAIRLPGAATQIWIRTFANIFPVENRLENWKRLGEILNCPLPRLIVTSAETGPQFPKGCRWPSQLVSWLLKNHPDMLPKQREEFHDEPPVGADKWTREDEDLGMG